MTYEELKKAYEEMSEKCSELEKKIEDKNLEIEVTVKPHPALNEPTSKC